MAFMQQIQLRLLSCQFSERPDNTRSFLTMAGLSPVGNGTIPHNKFLEQVIREPGRQPSPQPTHLAVPGTPHRILEESGSGYVAPKFEGKEQQMEQGMRASYHLWPPADLCSYGSN